MPHDQPAATERERLQTLTADSPIGYYECRHILNAPDYVVVRWWNGRCLFHSKRELDDCCLQNYTDFIPLLAAPPPPLTNDQLLTMAKKNRPPQSFYEGDEERLFDAPPAAAVPTCELPTFDIHSSYQKLYEAMRGCREDGSAEAIAYCRGYRDSQYEAAQVFDGWSQAVPGEAVTTDPTTLREAAELIVDEFGNGHLSRRESAVRYAECLLERSRILARRPVAAVPSEAGEVDNLRESLATAMKVIGDWSEEEDLVKAEAAKVLDAKWLEGDSYAVPCTAVIVDELVKQLTAARAEIATARAALTRIANPDSTLHDFGSLVSLARETLGALAKAPPAKE